MASVDDARRLVAESSQNRANLEDLLVALQRAAGLIPFVGAGLSRPFGFPEWGGFLRAQSVDAGIAPAMEQRLAKGEYEEAAEDLQEALGDLAFEDAIRRTFGAKDWAGQLPDAAVRTLPRLASGPVLTTNFDHVLEVVFAESGRPFEDVVWGAQPAQISQALHLNGQLLWKLHGDFKTRTDRVLTHSEYAEQYGHSDPAQIDWQKPLPRLFENLLGARPVLFLGCSLDQDRTVRILRAFTMRHPGVGHYALLEDPGEDLKHQLRARALSNVGIRPLWFPRGRFDLITPFLQYLADQQGRADRSGIASQRERIERGIEEQRHAFVDSAAASPAEPQRVVGDRPDRTESFRGRESYLQEVGEHLTAESTRLVSLVGPSGIGKTALAVRLLTGLETNRWPPPVAGREVTGVAYLSTRTEGITFERLFFACARMLGGNARADLERDWKKDQLGIDEKIQRLLDALAMPAGSLYVILLDHIEDLLDGEGRLTDEAIRKLVERSLSARGGPRLLITSRVRLALSRETAKLDRPVILSEGLSEDDGISMLRDLDRGSGLKQLPDQALVRVVRRLHGVPRALEVFAGILADDDTETIDQLLDRFYDRDDVVSEVFKEGINRLDENSQRVVDALAVFGQPVPAAAIDFLLQPYVPGLDLPATLRRLSRGQIVRVLDRMKGTWGLHPIDQDFAYARLEETGRNGRQEMHHRAAEWYASVRTPKDMWRSIDALEPLLREFDHLVKACIYDDAAAVLAEFDDDLLGRLGHAGRSLAMHLQVHGRVTVDRIRMYELLGLAHAYRSVGPIEKAIEGYGQSLAMARALEHVPIEIESLGWTGESFRRLGRLEEAVACVREAVALARQSSDRVRVARWLGELALICCYRGELAEALSAAEEAHATAVAVHEVNWEALAIDALALVHLVRCEPQKAIQAGERAIQMYQQGTWEHTVIYVLNVIGLAYLDLQDIDRAIDSMERALAEALVCEEIRVEGMARFNLAHAYRLKPDVIKALDYADVAVQRFRRTGGGELAAAEALMEALKARAAGIAGAEARALVAVARASLSNPDLRHPRDILVDAIRLAQGARLNDLAVEAEQLLARADGRSGVIEPAG